jgi:2-dehydro-3-deoxygluconokinase
MTAAVRPEVLTVGESMALLDPVTDGPIEAGMNFSLRVAGAESNFAIALRRLGVPVTWVSRLGADPLGDVIYESLSAEGLDLSWVRRDPAPTGVFFKWRAEGSSHVLYYRRDSAASRLEPADVPDAKLVEAALVHLTGITMALSESARRTVVDVARRAHSHKSTVLFDPNYRPALWSGPEAAATAHSEILDSVDWYLCGLEEGNLLWGTSDPESLFEAMAAAGVRRAVVREAEGAFVVQHGDVVKVVPDRREEVVDEIGAGDGFAAGFAFGLISGWRAVDCARAGHLIAARALRGTGDWETFPVLAEVEEELRPAGERESSAREA